mmetsp:Transcript_45175/g.144703  ORF Transcript_45175/g.144703 Transcript_45175/m.144703 type:complete len:309 (-) Transcript_45175:155-1081(-)
MLVPFRQEGQAVGGVPWVVQQRRREQPFKDGEEGKDLHRHVPQGRECVLQDQASGQWERPFPSGIQALPQQVRHDLDRDGAADGAAEEQDAIRAHLGLGGVLTRVDALDQKPVRAKGIHDETLLRTSAAIFGVSVAAVVQDEDVDLQLVVHVPDVLKSVADVASVAVEVDQGVGHLILASGKRLIDEPSIDLRSVLGLDHEILIGQAPSVRALVHARVLLGGPLRPGRRGHVDDFALLGHKHHQQYQSAKHDNLQQAEEEPHNPGQPLSLLNGLLLSISHDGLRGAWADEVVDNQSDDDQAADDKAPL